MSQEVQIELTGPRESGKSILMKHISRYLQDLGFDVKVVDPFGTAGRIEKHALIVETTLPLLECAGKTTQAKTASSPLAMILNCPSCGERHIDEGEWATTSHHTHACQSCGMVWRPAIEPTYGVQFLPGFKN